LVPSKGDCMEVLLKATTFNNVSRHSHYTVNAANF
jgi:hypothetical protein